MTDIQVGRVVQQALVRSKAYKSWRAASEYEYAISSHYGVPYYLDDEKILGGALASVCAGLAGFCGRSADDLAAAYELYVHSEVPSFISC